MKNIKFFLAIVLFAGFSSCSKEAFMDGAKNIPNNVRTAFATDYPSAQDQEWEVEGEYYEVEFELGKTEMEVVYSDKAQVMMVETEINPSQLPTSIIEYLNANYPGFEIEEAEMVAPTEGRMVYEVEIEVNDKEFELVFGGNGDFIEMEMEDDYEDENENEDNDD